MRSLLRIGFVLSLLGMFTGSANAQTPTGPLTIHIGDSDFTFGGFLDMTSITRSTNTGNGIGTNFSNFPFKTTAAGPTVPGNMPETRFSAQNSRLTLMATSKVGSADVKGYFEADFLGNTAQNLNVTSNSDTLRMRLYWGQYINGKFEFLAGQSWSMITPNRNGIGAMPGDLFYSQDVDTNYQAGLTWMRTPGFRFVYHASPIVTAGLALENPEQYIGSAVVLPKAFAAATAAGGQPQDDNGGGSSLVGTSSTTPNLYPDIIGKVAFDPKVGKTHQHIDAMVQIRGYRTFNPATSTNSDLTGTGFSVNGVFEPMTTTHLIATNYFGNGSGRSIANTNLPDFIVNSDFSMSKVKTFSGIYGVEQNVSNSLVYGYYSYVHADSLTGLDTDGKTAIGFGTVGNTNANNKIQEATIGLTQTFFRDAKVGGMQLMIQYSYLKRTPFSVPVGTDSNATMNMLYVNVRYIWP